MKTPNVKKLLSTPQDKWEETSNDKHIKCLEDDSSSGKFGQVLFGEISPSVNKFKSPNVAIKSQPIKHPKDLTDVSYRELLIFKELKKLSDEQKCDGFVYIYDWFKSQGNKDAEGDQFMNIVLERADITLRQYITTNEFLPLAEAKSILFQILYGLYHAQTTMEFMHNDLHFKNVMLKKTPKDVRQTVYYVFGKRFVSKIPYIVKITDFGLSRITKSNDDIIYNPKTTKWFNPASDLIQIANELKKAPISWNDVENSEVEKSHFSNLKKVLQKQFNVDWQAILNHPFFESMNTDSSDGASLSYGDLSLEKIFSKKLSTPILDQKTLIKSRKDQKVKQIAPLDFEVFNSTIIKSRKERRLMKDLNQI